MDGPPFARYIAFGHRVQAEVGFPFVGRLVEDGHVYRTELPGGRAVTATHAGPYETIGTTWDAARAWIDEQGLEVAGPAWESYLTGPEDPGPPVTEIYWPIR
jgi:effector-binding domain-containing protein